MLYLTHILAIFIYFSLIIYTCYLFSGAIEHLGKKLKFGNNAVGSILAVIGTCLPETIVPLVAIFGSVLLKRDIEMGQNVALGAIFGSPFLLSTLALFLLGIVLIFKKRKEKELVLDAKNIIRDYKYFLCAYCLAIFASFLNNLTAKAIVVFILIISYTVFAFRTIVKSKKNYVEKELDSLLICKLLRCEEKNEIKCIIIQLLISIILLALFSRLFVNEIEYFSTLLNLSPIILSLIITPFATELPECINSIIWLREDKDDLALANVLGAMVFQAMIPTSIGILFTPWVLNNILLTNALCTITCSLIFITLVFLTKKIKLPYLIFPVIFYILFFLYVF